MLLTFTKMQGLGNDFVVVDDRRERLRPDAALARRLADRKRGVGCDQVLIIGPPRTAASLLSFRIFNADGGEVEHCGNGARCVARYARARGLTEDDAFSMDLPAGAVGARVQDDGTVAVDMGEPDFRPAALPMLVPTEAEVYTLRDVGGCDVQLGAVSMGNPHAVIVVDDVTDVPLARLGPAVQGHAAFPRGVNVGVVAIDGRGAIRLRVYERGAGETQACGTGACAAVAVLRRRALLDETVAVHLPGGVLHIDWPGPGQALWMRGPAAFVFNGEMEI